MVENTLEGISCLHFFSQSGKIVLTTCDCQKVPEPENAFIYTRGKQNSRKGKKILSENSG